VAAPRAHAVPVTDGQLGAQWQGEMSVLQCDNQSAALVPGNLHSGQGLKPPAQSERMVIVMAPVGVVITLSIQVTGSALQSVGDGACSPPGRAPAAGIEAHGPVADGPNVALGVECLALPFHPAQILRAHPAARCLCMRSASEPLLSHLHAAAGLPYLHAKAKRLASGSNSADR